MFDMKKWIELVMGPILATVILIYPGIFAAMLDFSFFLNLAAGKKVQVSFSDALPTAAMAIIFPVGLAATWILWRLVWLGTENLIGIKKWAMVTVLITAIAETVWVLAGMPGIFNSPPFSVRLLLLLIGPLIVATKYLYVLLAAKS